MSEENIRPALHATTSISETFVAFREFKSSRDVCKSWIPGLRQVGVQTRGRSIIADSLYYAIIQLGTRDAN